MKTKFFWLMAGILLLVGGAYLIIDYLTRPPGKTSSSLMGKLGLGGGSETYDIELTDYRPPQNKENDDVLVDDKLSDKKLTPFDPALVDRRPLGPKGEWLVNSSSAIIRLDVPILKPDQDAVLLVLHPSYAAAVKTQPGANILPSVNLLDGKAKQFDDGLYAALDQAYYLGLEKKLAGHIQLIRRLYDRVGKDSPAAPFLAAGLELAGVHVEPSNLSAKQQMLQAFEALEVRSKPIGFYTWNETLSACFRFLRFFQQNFNDNDAAIPLAIARAFHDDSSSLFADYQKALGFYARLTNPYHTRPIADIVGKDSFTGTVALFPGSTSKETVLFEKLFPQGLPPGANLMRELVTAIRSGKVDLQPGPRSGWYDHQVYALETLLLAEKGMEHDKLLLTKAYKKRMLEAFQALMTKRRETHVRQLSNAEPTSAGLPPPLQKVSPRLRVEPNPSYYVRTARAYAFLANFLESAVGPEQLRALHGLKQGGQRTKSLGTELSEMRDLFYGFYLLSAEDIGLKPSFARDESVDTEKCYRLAVDWLPKALQDEDLAADTRVAVPVYVDFSKVRCWATLGVRLARLESSYVRPPSIKPAAGGEWKEVEADKLEGANYLIAVDEFAEFELRGSKVLSREDFRAICDREKTKAKIIQALQQ